MDALAAHRIASARQQGLATRSQLQSAGLLRRGLEDAVATGTLVRVRRAVYAAAPLPAVPAHLLTAGRPDPAYVARVRAVLLALGPRAAAARRTAAVLWGFDMAVEPEDVEVDVAPGRTRVTMGGVDVVRTPLGDVARCAVAGAAPLPVTSPVATVLGCAASLPVAEAVAIADSALRTRRVTLAGLRKAVASRRGEPGARRIRRVLTLCDAACGSVLESLLRVLLCEHGLRPPRTQHAVTDARGRLIARVDFAWPDARLLVEADGRRWHDPQDARNVDRRKANTFTGLGWGLLRFTWAEVVHEPAYVVAAVSASLAVRAA